jgi:hypothetical protein
LGLERERERIFEIEMAYVSADMCVVGLGVMGLSTIYQTMKRHPHLKVFSSEIEIFWLMVILSLSLGDWAGAIRSSP